MGIDAKMLVRTTEPVTDEQINLWGYRLGEIFGAERFWLSWPGQYGDDYQPFDGGHRAIERIEEYHQDGPTLEPLEGETFLEIHVGTRYYGVGYERGDLTFLINVAEWCERNIPGAEVWYGGDSSGVEAAPFTQAVRENLRQHLERVGHEPYESGWSRFDSDGIEVPTSTLYGMPMRRNAWGQDYGEFYCPGSGEVKIWKQGRWLTPNEVREIKKGAA